MWVRQGNPDTGPANSDVCRAQLPVLLRGAVPLRWGGDGRRLRRRYLQGGVLGFLSLLVSTRPSEHVSQLFT